MDIVQVGNESVPIPPSGWGGVERWVADISLVLAKKHNVNIVTLPSMHEKGYERISFHEMGKIKYYFHKLERYLRHYGFPLYTQIMNHNQTALSIYQSFLMKTLSDMEGEVFHFHQRPEYLYSAKKNDVLNGGKTVIHIHNEFSDLFYWFPRLKSFDGGLKLADCIIGTSNSMKEYLIKRGVPKEKTSVIYNGVNTQKFRPNPRLKKGNRILFVGVSVKRKGILPLIKAFQRTGQKFREWELRIAGNWQTDDNEYFRKMKEAAGNNQNIKFLGSLGDEALIKEYQSADIAVLPSFFESFGMVLLEAMSCGAAGIGANAGGIPEFFGKKDGILIEPGDVSDIKNALEYLMENESERKRMSRNARKDAERFSWGNVSRDLIKLYKSI